VKAATDTGIRVSRIQFYIQLQVTEGIYN
jgi:methionyl aminopeptidase